MQVPSSIAAALFNIANADAASQRQAMSSNGAEASNTALQADESSTNVVLSAQGQNALAAEQAAKASAANAASFAKLGGFGIKASTTSFADVYQSQLLQAVDPNGSGTVTEDSLEQQVTAGGGTKAEADTLYKAMDEDGDGKVSDQEFKDSIPSPFNTPDFGKEFIAQQMSGGGDAAATPNLDSSLILANLAMQESGKA
jgi:hypothetical protein